jgi:GMP synthase-like glutamine amidotransferase
MILYIITDTEEKARSDNFNRHRWTLEDLSEDVCVGVHFRRVNMGLVDRLQPWAVCHSGSGTPFEEYGLLEHADYRRVIMECRAAQIGLCGGHQAIAHVFGGSLGSMRPLRPEDPDLNPAYHPGFFKEAGIFPVRIVRRDPLFDGLSDVMRVHEAHRDEVKDLGPDLVLLASSDNCRVQAYVHRSRPIYGTQFHPEQATQSYPDGFRILRNFFRIAKSRG